MVLTPLLCLQFREVFLTPDYLGIAMEYAAGGDMFQHVTSKRGLSEDEARWFFQQLVLGLDYCHKMGIVNRDIKLEVSLTLPDYAQWGIGAEVLHSMLPEGSAKPDTRTVIPQNTLLDGSRRPLLKICDFGYSKHEKDSLPKSKVGTPGYTGNRHL